jgi:hypothetical protein
MSWTVTTGVLVDGGIRLKSEAVEGLRESPELGMNLISLLLR